MRFTSRLLHDSFGPDKATGAVTQPLYQSTAFYQETAEDRKTQGDEIVASGGLYGGTSSIFRDLAEFGIRVHYAKGDAPEDFAELITERTRLLYVENIGNPKLNVVDIEALAKLAES